MKKRNLLCCSVEKKKKIKKSKRKACMDADKAGDTGQLIEQYEEAIAISLLAIIACFNTK